MDYMHFTWNIYHYWNIFDQLHQVVGITSIVSHLGPRCVCLYLISLNWTVLMVMMCVCGRWTVCQWTPVQRVYRSSWCPSRAVATLSCSAPGHSRTPAALKKRPLQRPGGRPHYIKKKKTQKTITLSESHRLTWNVYVLTLSEGPSRDVVLHLTTGRIHNKNVSTHLIGSISKGAQWESALKETWRNRYPHISFCKLL